MSLDLFITFRKSECECLSCLNEVSLVGRETFFSFPEKQVIKTKSEMCFKNLSVLKKTGNRTFSNSLSDKSPAEVKDYPASLTEEFGGSAPLPFIRLHVIRKYLDIFCP